MDQYYSEDARHIIGQLAELDNETDLNNEPDLDNETDSNIGYELATETDSDDDVVVLPISMTETQDLHNSLEVETQNQQISVIEIEDDQSSVEILEPSDVSNSSQSSDAKKRKRSPEKDVHNLSASYDESITCPVCYEQWEISGDRRLVSLKCGHLFCKLCMRKWFVECRKNYCPSCNSPAYEIDLRPIYAKRIHAIDRTEEYNRIKECKKERQKNFTLKTENSFLKMELDLRNKLIKSLHDTIQDLTNPSNRTPQFRVKKTVLKLSLEKKFDLSPDTNSCRVLAYASKSKTMLVSQKSSNTLFRGHGVRYIDLMSLRLKQFYPISERDIRDINLDNHQKYFVTATMSEKVSIYNVDNGTIAAQYNGTNAVWSAAFDPCHEHRLICGTNNGNIFHFDSRHTTNEIVNNASTNKTPIICIIPIAADDTFPYGGYVVCQLAFAFISEYTESGSLIQTRILIDGPFISLSYNSDKKLFLFSTRPNKKNNFSSIIAVRLSRIADTIVSEIVHTFQGSKIVSQMAKSTQINHGQDTLIASYLEDTQLITTWDLNSKKKIQEISLAQNALDMCSFQIESNSFLSTLTGHRFYLYKLHEASR